MKSWTISSLSVLSVLLAVAGCKKSYPSTDSATSATAPAALVPVDTKGFEGEIDLLAKSVKEPASPPVTVLIKNTKFRFDIPKGTDPSHPASGYMIVDAPSKKMFTVMDAQKQVVVVPLDQLADQLKTWKSQGAPAGAAPGTTGKVTKTGHMETIAGISCEDWDVTAAKGDRAQLCVATQSAAWFQVPNMGLSGDDAWANQLFDGEHLPLRVTGYDATGAEQGRFEVTKLEKRPLADSLFEIPTGYRTTDLGEMMKTVLGGGAMQGATGGQGFPAPPPGMQLPPGMTLPPGMKLPPGVQVPSGMTLTPAQEAMLKQMQERARAMAPQAPPK